MSAPQEERGDKFIHDVMVIRSHMDKIYPYKDSSPHYKQIMNSLDTALSLARGEKEPTC